MRTYLAAHQECNLAMFSWCGGVSSNTEAGINIYLNAMSGLEADYPDPFCAMVWRDNLYATQFHPEKSQRQGLAILRNFAELT